MLDIDLYMVVKLSYTSCYNNLKSFITYYGGVGYEVQTVVFRNSQHNNGV